MPRRRRRRADSFLEGLCLFREYIYIMFVIALVMFGLSLISWSVVEPGTETYMIVLLNLVALGTFVVISGAVLALCRDKAY